jgi:hypothetical protein
MPMKHDLREYLTGFRSHDAGAGDETRNPALVKQIRFERLAANVAGTESRYDRFARPTNAKQRPE